MRAVGSLTLIVLSASASPGGASSRPDETVRIAGVGNGSVRLTSNTCAHVSRLFEAMARPVAFSRDDSRCTSRGVLETRLADALKEQLTQ